MVDIRELVWPYNDPLWWRTMHEEDGCEVCHDAHLEEGKYVDGCWACEAWKKENEETN